ncbi:Pycsar system effector family protein [Halobellus inordinatus]|uniref:Pycsar system effector family protein n=1 Tax=Halobellus inordinatus TaxID=1126236 RepID=UPI0021154733|nr:Pycsar system effector family protein [Halobellus ramosii]
MASDNRIELLSQTTNHFNRYILQADKKAAIVISGHLAFIGLLINSTLWSERVCILYGVIGLSLLSIGSGIYTVFPRFVDHNRENANLGNLNWRVASQGDYAESVLDEDIERGVESLAASNEALASVLRRKYRWLRVSLVASGGTILIACLSLV